MLVAVADELPLILVPDALPVTRKAHLLSGKCTHRIYSRLVMASREATNSGPRQSTLDLTRQSFCSLSTKLAHAQSMNIAKKGLLAIEVDFLGRALERTLHAIATMQSLPHLRSAPVHMSVRCGPAHPATLSKISGENSE